MGGRYKSRNQKGETMAKSKSQNARASKAAIQVNIALKIFQNLCHRVEERAEQLGIPPLEAVDWAVKRYAEGQPNLDEKHLEQLREYSEISGVPIDRQVYEAMEEYIEVVLSTRMEALAERTASA
jgi:hypothetical protein